MLNYQNFAAYFNGEWVNYGDVKIAPHDRGFSLADVVFDSARTFNGKPFRLESHIDRLYRSLKYVRIDPGLSAKEMEEICRDGVVRNMHHRSEVGDFAIHAFVTRGFSYEGPPTISVVISPIDFASFARSYIYGVHGVIARTRAFSSESLDPKVKHKVRLNLILAELEARDVDADAQPILLDGDGNVAEGMGCNVFMVKNGVLKTPGDKSILQGVSRDTVINVAKQLGIPTVEEDLQPYDMYNADEIFFTRTSPRITPVVKVDKRSIGDETPGPITRQLLAAHSEMVGVDIVDQALHFAGIKA